MVSVVIVLSEVTAILENDGIQGQKYVAWFQGSEIPVEFHNRSLLSGI